MKNILVPVDYSDTAKNAMHYAVHFARQLGAGKIILYNAFQPPVPVDNIGIATDGNFNAIGFYDIESLTDSNKVHLERLKDELKQAAGDDITIEGFSEYNLLPDGVETVSKSHNIDFIIMGISEASGVSETLVGSNSLDVARQVTTPVIIVPHAATYKPIRQVLFTCDYKNIPETVPVTLFKDLLAATGARLHVLHVDAAAEKEEHLQQAAILKELLSDVAAEYHTWQHAQFKEAVNQFVAQNSIDLIAAIPKRHRFFESLFHHSHTKDLAFHSTVPLLLMHD